MIYFETSIRDKVVKKLHRSLHEDGLLVIGNFENYDHYRDHFDKTSLGHSQILAKSAIDYSESDHGHRPDDHAQRDSGTNEVNQEGLTITEDRHLDPDYKLITIRGIINKEISEETFEKALKDCMLSYTDPIVLDFSNVPFISKKHKEQLKKICQTNLLDCGRIIFITSNTSLKEWINEQFDSNNHECHESFSEDQIVNGNTNNSQLNGNSNGSDLSQGNGTLERKSHRHHSDAVTFQASDNGYELIFTGILCTGESSELTELIKDKITTILDKIKQEPTKNVIEINLDEVDRFDRDFVQILRRLENLTESEPFELEITVEDDSIRQTLERWGQPV
jgi:anti-anti-sigma regulatory factor